MEAYKPEYSLFIADGLGFMLIILYLLFTNKEYSAKNQIRASYIIWIINLICIPIWAFTLPPLWAFILIFLHILFNCKLCTSPIIYSCQSRCSGVCYARIGRINIPRIDNSCDGRTGI